MRYVLAAAAAAVLTAQTPLPTAPPRSPYRPIVIIDASKVLNAASARPTARAKSRPVPPRRRHPLAVPTADVFSHIEAGGTAPPR